MKPTLAVAALAALLFAAWPPRNAVAYHEGPLLERALFCYGAAWALVEMLAAFRETMHEAASRETDELMEGALDVGAIVIEPHLDSIAENVANCLAAVNGLAQPDAAVNSVARQVVAELEAAAKAVDRYEQEWPAQADVLYAMFDDDPVLAPPSLDSFEYHVQWARPTIADALEQARLLVERTQ